MAWEEVTRKLACPTCGTNGEFIYEVSDRSYGSGEMNFKELTAGFTLKRSGAPLSSTIICTTCQAVVEGSERSAGRTLRP
jgi:hypothetical protein